MPPGRFSSVAVLVAGSALFAFPAHLSAQRSGLPGFVVDAWFGLAATARTPNETIAKLNADTVHGMTDADVRERLAGQGLYVKTGSPAELAALMQGEIMKWRKVVKAANLKLE